MKKILLSAIIFIIVNSIYSQTTINQNGLQSTVISGLSAQATQAKSYEIANIGYNSWHWQNGGIIIVEIYQKYYSTDYQKYIIENGYHQGVNTGLPLLKLVDCHGKDHLANITLGTSTDLSTSFYGYINKQLPIVFNVQNNAIYTIKITYTQSKVDQLDALNQIKINETPTGTNIPNFTVSSELNTNLFNSGSLRVTGADNHYIQNGNFGIGTTNPSTKLHINNGNNSYGAILANADEFAFSLYTKTLTTLPANSETFRFGLKYFSDEKNGFISFYRGGDTYGGFLGFSTNGLERIRISSSGNIGIGTTSPLNKLDVNGTIHSKEVKVDMIGWSDFVFKSDYSLPTLEEVEKQIKANGHLKDIPNEADVIKNGIYLGEMNAKLLQKIEELTLYSIEQHKNNLELRQKVEKLEQENEKFKTFSERLSEIENQLK